MKVSQLDTISKNELVKALELTNRDNAFLTDLMATILPRLLELFKALAQKAQEIHRDQETQEIYDEQNLLLDSVLAQVRKTQESNLFLSGQEPDEVLAATCKWAQSQCASHLEAKLAARERLLARCRWHFEEFRE